MNPHALLAQFLGPGAAGVVLGGASRALGGSGGMAAGALAAGGLLALLVGSKKMRKLAGGAVGVGGGAALGALAYRAYAQWQSAQQQAPPVEQRFLPSAAPARDGNPFELALVAAMIAASNADGHIGPEEQRRIFDRVGALPLDADEKAFVFDILARPPGLDEVAALANGPEQGAEIYLVSRLAIDPEHPAERVYLQMLAERLLLPEGLVRRLEGQASIAFG